MAGRIQLQTRPITSVLHRPERFLNPIILELPKDPPGVLLTSVILQ